MKKRILALLVAGVAALSLAACTGDDAPEVTETETSTDTETDIDTDTETADTTETETMNETAPESDSTPAENETNPATESDTAADTAGETADGTETESIKDQLGLNVSLSDLDSLMQPIFAGDTVKNETVMFIEKTDEKALLYPIDTVISVTSYDGKTVYEEGKDYTVKDGKLYLTEGTSIPVITAAKYYNVADAAVQLVTQYNGQNVNTYWGEGRLMTNWQVSVNYTYTAEWEGYEQACSLDVYQDFIRKLVAGEDVTIFFYGDSITHGSSSSWNAGYGTKQYPYSILFTEALADLFDYTVHYAEGYKLPKDYVAGDRGTITYVNTAVGGWQSTDGVTNLKTHVTDKIATYGCDLFVVAFGMNDGFSPREGVQNNQTMIDGVLAVAPDTDVLIVSTMVPNPNATNGWYGNQPKQEKFLLNLAEEYREAGTSCAVACMTSVSLAVLEHKEFNDYTGNNINHPNDYCIRLYAQTLLQTVVGYENMN